MNFLRFSILIATLLVTTPTMHAANMFRDTSITISEPTIAQLIDSVGLSANKQITDILGQQVPRLSYTGIAFVAGIMGIFVADNGLNRLCKGIDEDQNKTIITGAAQLSAGLSTVAASITAIYLLWNKH